MSTNEYKANWKVLRWVPKASYGYRRQTQPFTSFLPNHFYLRVVAVRLAIIEYWRYWRLSLLSMWLKGLTSTETFLPVGCNHSAKPEFLRPKGAPGMGLNIHLRRIESYKSKPLVGHISNSLPIQVRVFMMDLKWANDALLYFRVLFTAHQRTMSANQKIPRKLQSRSKALRASAAAKRKLQIKNMEAVAPFLSSLERAAFGNDDDPVSCWRTDEILISNKNWAALILHAAKAFKQILELEVFIPQPLTPAGLGGEAGSHTFQLAIEGASVKVISQSLAESREALGPWREESPFANISVNDTEQGITSFFRQLYKGYVEQPLPVNGDQTKPKLSVSERKVLDALAFESLCQYKLARKALGKDGKPSYVRNLVFKLREKGFTIQNDKDNGYTYLR